jgi:hypothetical protein
MFAKRNLRKSSVQGAKPSVLRTMLSMYAPDEPLGPPEGDIMVQQRGAGWVVGQRKRWPQSVFKLREKFAGFQPGHRHREDMKYGRTPASDAPLSEWITAFINHSKAIWSRDLDRRVHHLQFDEWFDIYIDNVVPWTNEPKMLEGVQVLRSKCEYFRRVRLMDNGTIGTCGLPRFAPPQRAAR